MTRHRALRPVLPGLLLSLTLGACYGELSGGSHPGTGLDPIGTAQPSEEQAAPAPVQPPTLGPAEPSAPPAAGPAPSEPEDAPAPPPSTRLSVTGIVGGAYAMTQPYGPAQHDYGYAYCHSYGDWPAGQIVHCGVDIGLAPGRALFAPDSGTVTVAGGSGYYIDVYNPAAGQLTLQLDDGTQVILGHCSEVLVRQGQRVARGEKVALSGQSSVGDNGHLHLEVRVSAGGGLRTVDPMEFFGP